MSEFETNPEQAMRAELTEIESKLAEVEQSFSELPDGNWEETGSTEEAEQLIARATSLKKNMYKLLVSLGDTEKIQRRLTEKTEETVELYEEEGMPIYVETILEDTFAISTGEELDPRVQEVVAKLTEEYGLQTFDEETETEE